MSTKQVIVINRGTTPPMRRGKEIAQGAHASLAFLTRRLQAAELLGWPGHLASMRLTDAETEWMKGSYRKVTLQASSAEELKDLCEKAMDAGLEAHLVTDAGLTEFSEPTVTALAIGPDYDEKIDPVTGHLALY
jgi:peptidyl-tRNA hydrolase, PTH2 family